MFCIGAERLVGPGDLVASKVRSNRGVRGREVETAACNLLK
jgi:hypothetical protein